MIWPFSTIAALRAELRHAQNLSHSYLGQFQDANAAKMELARQLAEACRERDEALRRESDLLAGNEINRKTLIKHNADHAKDIEKARKDIALMFCALLDIHTAGAASKNGTARKLGRMAREVLE